jgi:putative DNA primase/helicase
MIIGRLEGARKQLGQLLPHINDHPKTKGAIMTPVEYWDSYASASPDHPALKIHNIPAEWCKTIPENAPIPFPDNDDFLVLPLHGASGDILSLAYIYPESGRTPRYSNGYPQGALICGTPNKSTPVYLLVDPSDAMCYYNAGHVALACFTPDDWSRQNISKKLTSGQNLAAVAKAWIKAGYQVIVPVPCHKADEYRNLLSDVSAAKIIPLLAPVAFLEPSELTTAYSRHVEQMPRSIDVHSPLVDTTDKGKPLSTSDNLAEVARRIGCIIRYNVISKKVELIMPDTSFSIDNHANACLSVLISWANRFKMPTGNTELFLTQIADQNPYNPVANWVTSRKWDGTSRIQAFYDTLTEVEPRCLPDGRRLRDVLIMRWMVSAIAAAFEPSGISSHGVLVLQGDQYLGKTKWMKDLAPKSLGVIKDGLTLNPSDKDSVLQCVSHWIIELGELDATFRKSDIASLKSFITSDRDILRRPYDRLPSEFARRTVFFASVNPRQFLHDSTGNRRFWVIECSDINHNHGLDMQQVWAEFYEMYKAGEAWFLSPEEMAVLNGKNEEFMAATPALEMVDSAFDWGLPANNRDVLMTATQIAHAAGIERPTKADVNDIAQHVRQKYKVIQRGDPRTKVKKFVMPATLFAGGKI